MTCKNNPEILVVKYYIKEFFFFIIILVRMHLKNKTQPKLLYTVLPNFNITYQVKKNSKIKAI